MRLVPCCQMLADVQAKGLTPISWLRFSSRTALTTTCTASNISAADSWKEGNNSAGANPCAARLQEDLLPCLFGALIFPIARVAEKPEMGRISYTLSCSAKLKINLECAHLGISSQYPTI